VKPLDFRDRVLLLLSTHTSWATNTEITHQQWSAMLPELYELIAETGDTAGCEHRLDPTGKLCLKCHRPPQSYNTLVTQ
jgi:hypothetical protein